MPTYLGTATPSAFKVGTADCSAIYLGTTLVWPAQPAQVTYGTESFTANWTQWTAINTLGSNSIASGVGTLSGPTNNSSGAQQYKTRRTAFTAAGARGDVTVQLDLQFPSLQEAYFDLGLATNATGLANPKGVYASFYPAGGSSDANYSLLDSDGTYTGKEQKFAFAYAANTWYTAKIRRRGKRVSFKIWVAGQTEPFSYGAWNSHGIDAAATGYLTLGITNGYSTTATMKFRNITVKSYIDEAGDTTPSSDTVPASGNVTSSGRTWALTSSQDFTTAVAEGGFRTAYPGVTSYAEEQTDTDSARTNGRYSTNKTVSVVGGVLTVNQRVIGGIPYGAMILADNYQGHLYGRAQFRSRQTDVAGVGGFKFVPLWWPSSDNWADGEIDWPEANNGDFPRPVSASVPPTYDNPPTNDHRVFYPADDVEADYDTSGWHVYTVDWAPDAVSFYQDGKLIARMTDSRGIPTKSMRFGFQMETWIGSTTTPAVPTNAVGKVELDWVAMYDMVS